MMRKLDYAVLGTSVLAVALFWVLGPTGTEYAIFVVSVLAAAPALIALTHQLLPLRSDLRVEYRNPMADDRPVLFPPYPGHPSSHLLVYLVNGGHGPARGIEVRFDRMGGEIYNESGNAPGPDVDQMVHPPTYRPPADFVLPAGRDRCIARLVWHVDNVNRDGTVQWHATAADRETEGVVRIRLEDRRSAPP